MKTFTSIIPLLCMLLIAFPAMAQDKKTRVNSVVNESFNEIYPGAVVKKWDDKKDDRYEVEFVYSNLEHEAYFAADGTWLYTERDIEINEVSVPALEAFKSSQWSGWKIDKIEEINSPDHPVLYVIKVKREDNKMYLYYLPDGSLHSATSKTVF